MIDKSAEELAFTAGGDAAKLLIDSYLGSASNEEELTFGIYILKSTALHLLATYLYNRDEQTGEAPWKVLAGEIPYAVEAIIERIKAAAKEEGLDHHTVASTEQVH